MAQMYVYTKQVTMKIGVFGYDEQQILPLNNKNMQITTPNAYGGIFTHKNPFGSWAKNLKEC